MCESIEIILPCIAHGHGIDSFPQEFDRLIANEILASRVDELTGEGLGESELMIKFPDEDRSGVRSDPLIDGVDLDRAVEFQFERVV